MKKIAIILFMIAYLPLFFVEAYRRYIAVGLSIEEIESLKKTLIPLIDICNHAYSVCTALGIGLILMSMKRKYLVPLYSFFFVITFVFALNAFFDTACSTFYPILLILLTMLLCTSIHLYLRHKRRQRLL